MACRVRELRLTRVATFVCVAALAALASTAAAADEPQPKPELPIGGRLLATGGVSQIEGAAGGGLVPWAVLAGYGSEGQVGAAAHYSRGGYQDFRLATYGAAVSVWDRVEVSLGQQELDVKPLDEKIGMLVVGGKLRLLGDLVYDDWGTVALGVQYKRNLDFDLPDAVGAYKKDGLDVYLAASKLWLDGVFGVPLLLNGAVRATRANQIGLLGFGGDENAGYSFMLEGSAALLVTRHLAIGYEYRQKPDNLSFAKEGPWQDAFAALFVNKHLALVGAYTWLDNVGPWGKQSGFYLSLQGSF